MSAPVQVHFELEDLLVEAPEGTSLQAIVEASGADVTFGCRNGSCGTCRIRVLRGLEHCSEAGPEERDFLAALGAPPDHRLACQVRLLGDVDIAYLGPP
ncbi:MAG: (2Fe-2S)-binding protein [Acidobacteria bacterium]|nr:(2Fe-2S)-binding protein [Acidobacteriota bacterium]